MNALEQRVQAALGSRTKSLWSDLIRIYENDPEAFYLLACDGTGEPFRDLASLAGDIRSAIRDTYEIESSDSGSNLVSASGITIAISKGILVDVERFLRTVDGKVNSETAGKDYVGVSASEAEMRFKLGEFSSWKADHARLQERLEAHPLVFRITNEEISHLASQPAYVTHGLLNCARKTVMAPSSVFRGLNRGDDCPTDLKEGWAFCGKPRQAFDNAGQRISAPQGMVYMVYADETGFVFDWDWVKEQESGYPMDWQLRFGNPLELKQDAVLELPTDWPVGTFNATEACYSSRGDCIFCYMTDEVSHAVRINADLTVFKSLKEDHYTGFKIKNVRRILQVDETIEMTDAPGLLVSVDSVLLATLKRHEGKDGDVQVYRVLIQALYRRETPPPTVRVPQGTADLVSA